VKRITVLYFAAVRDLVGRAEEEVELPDGVARIEELAAWLVGHHPSLDGRLTYVRFARNEELVELAAPVAEGDVVALLPPVAGG